MVDNDFLKPCSMPQLEELNAQLWSDKPRIGLMYWADVLFVQVTLFDRQPLPYSASDTRLQSSHPRGWFSTRLPGTSRLDQEGL